MYWSSTMRDHVVYESRLELTRLLYADFDQDVTAVFAQPFLLSTTVDGRRRRHVPDFLVMREKDVPLVVDVKPRHLLTRPKVNFALGLAREVVLSRGWDFQVWSEPPEAELTNLRFLAGYRRNWLELRITGDVVEVVVWDSDPVLPVARAADPGRVASTAWRS
jgi:hypothetical protein